jgi:hypothetical protein
MLLLAFGEINNHSGSRKPGSLSASLRFFVLLTLMLNVLLDLDS